MQASPEMPEQGRWMNLVDALAYIQSQQKCNSLAAQVQLKHAIGRGVIPVKWADSKGPRDHPDASNLQRSKLVLSGPGLALDDDTLRSLLLLRSAVLSAWAPATSASARPTNANLHARRDEQWMSLVEAAEHVQLVQNTDSVDALRQLKHEIHDGLVPVQWEDANGPKDCPDPKALLNSELLLVGTGLAPDYVNGSYRPLLVDRSVVQKLWALPTLLQKPARADAAPTARKSPPPSKAQIREEIRRIYADPVNNRPNMNRAYSLVRLKLPRASRNMVREVLREPDFADQRRGPGNQADS